MNRSELIDAIAKQTGATKADTDRFLNEASRQHLEMSGL
jgi:nucleoid DNA-binding protein